MRKKQKILLLVAILLLGQVLPEIIFGQSATSTIDLEVLYPEIFGKAPRPGVTLPNYIGYIYLLAVAFLGLIIFGLLIYNGFLYLTSVGQAERMNEARKGILAAFLGALILLSGFLIFNTLSPHLTLLTPPPIGKLAEFIPPGVYLCNHKPQGIETILERYQKGDKKAAEDFYSVILKHGYFRTSYCQLAESGEVKMGGGVDSLFVVPERVYNPEKNEFTWEYNTAIIIKSKTYKGVACSLFPEPKNKELFHQEIKNRGLPNVDELVVIKKPPEPELEVTLYEGRNYNQAGKYVDGKWKREGLKEVTYKLNPQEDIILVTENDLKNVGLWESTSYNGDINLVKSVGIKEPEKTIVVFKGRFFDVTSGVIIGSDLCDIIDINTNKERPEVARNLDLLSVGRCGERCEMETTIEGPEKVKMEKLDTYCHTCPCQGCDAQIYIIRGTPQ